MQLHRNAKTTPRSRLDLVQRLLAGQQPEEVAEAFGVSVRTSYKWLRRYREDGLEGLEDRSSAPHRIQRTSAARVRRIVALRRKRRTGWQIAERPDLALSTVHAVLRREGLARLSMLDPKPEVRRYERERAGELLHLDTKPLARIHRVGHRIHGDRSLRVKRAGWEYAHVAIDDASRFPVVGKGRDRPPRVTGWREPDGVRGSGQALVLASVWRPPRIHCSCSVL